MSRGKVAIVQTYVAKYRLHFYTGLVEALKKSDIDLVVVAASSPSGGYALRRDATEKSPWLRCMEPKQVNLGRIAVPPFYGTSRHWNDCEGIILTLRGNSIDLNAELARKRFSGRRIATWGHVKSYVKAGNALDMAIERHQMRLSDHVFAYTQSGADYAVQAGVDPKTVTTVVNSTDVSETLAFTESMDMSVVEEFENRHCLTRGKTFGYLGGIDSVKRVDLLADVLDMLWKRDPQVRLVVGGRGDLEHLLSDAVRRGQVVLIGYAGPEEKALINHISEAIVNPGRIGLVAVECMAMGLPILTTDWKFHGPEYEYLVEGDHVFISTGGPEQFADLVVRHTKASDDSRRPRPKPHPTLETMVENFANGVIRMMS